MNQTDQRRLLETLHGGSLVTWNKNNNTTTAATDSPIFMLCRRGSTRSINTRRKNTSGHPPPPPTRKIGKRSFFPRYFIDEKRCTVHKQRVRLPVQGRGFYPLIKRNGLSRAEHSTDRSVLFSGGYTVTSHRNVYWRNLRNFLPFKYYFAINRRI